jgi:hypothetical protein
MNSNEYEAAQYRGKQWGLFHKPTKNWSVFGTRAAMEKRAAELNAPRARCTCGPVRHWECNAGCRAGRTP